ncbi:MAG: hypothetical protein LUG18_15625 [Candidatus Azobacteroides sp.]|nr:hypothetical protein [Candidatus Azobacteroides sp.]
MKKILLLATSLVASLGLMAQTYYVAGSGADDPNGNFCDGKNWDPAGSVMQGTNPATITFENVGAGTYEFKITLGNWNDGDWGGSAYTGPQMVGIISTGNNMKFTISQDSDITINFDGNEKKITSITSSNGFGELVITSYTLVGSEEIFGAGHDVNTEANDMEKNEIGIWEKWYEGINMGSYTYKLVGNHSYAAFELPEGENGFYEVMVEIDDSVILFTYDPLSGVLNATVNPETVTSLNDIDADVQLSASNGTIYCSEDNFTIYNLVGVNVTAQNGQLSGIYIVKYGNSAATIAVK